jgi:hypothetical protein
MGVQAQAPSAPPPQALSRSQQLRHRYILANAPGGKRWSVVSPPKGASPHIRPS